MGDTRVDIMFLKHILARHKKHCHPVTCDHGIQVIFSFYLHTPGFWGSYFAMASYDRPAPE